MSDIKSANPKTLVKLGILTVGILGFVIWNISKSLSSSGPVTPAATPPPTASPATNPNGKKPDVPGATGATGTQTPGGQTAKKDTLPTDTANGGVDGGGLDDPSITKQAKSGKPGKENLSGEARLAGGVNPFGPLPNKPEVPVSAPAPNPAPYVDRNLPRPSKGLLPAVSGLGSAPMAPSVGSIPPPAVPGRPNLPPAEPELIGTMLGELPCAVFHGERRLVVVPVGQRVNGWKVVSVNHGGAMLQSGNFVLHLSVNSHPVEGEVRPSKRASGFSTSQNTPRMEPNVAEQVPAKQTLPTQPASSSVSSVSNDSEDASPLLQEIDDLYALFVYTLLNPSGETVYDLLYHAIVQDKEATEQASALAPANGTSLVVLGPRASSGSITSEEDSSPAPVSSGQSSPTPQPVAQPVVASTKKAPSISAPRHRQYRPRHRWHSRRYYQQRRYARYHRYRNRLTHLSRSQKAHTTF